MLLSRILEVLTAVRTHQEIDISNEESRFLDESGLIMVLPGAEFREQRAEAEKLAAAKAAAENAKKEAWDLYEAWLNVDVKLRSFWYRFCAGKARVKKEGEERKKLGADWRDKEIVGGRLWREFYRLESLAVKLSKYAVLNGNWARLTPVGEFVRKHLCSDITAMPELGSAYYKNHIQTLFAQAVSELEDKYSY